jgi:hypothetical protein
MTNSNEDYLDREYWWKSKEKTEAVAVLFPELSAGGTRQR